MRRKRLVALLGAGIMVVNLIAPSSMSVVQASEVKTEQTEDAGQTVDEKEPEEVVEESSEEEGVTEKSEQKETAEEMVQPESDDNTSLAVDTQEEKVVIDSGKCGATEKDDVMCIDLIEDIGNNLGKHIAGLINILNPELVIIGGALSLTGDYILQPIKTAVRKYSLNLVNRDTTIVISKLGDNAGLIGSCLISRSRMFEE